MVADNVNLKVLFRTDLNNHMDPEFNNLNIKIHDLLIKRVTGLYFKKTLSVVQKIYIIISFNV